MRNWLEFWNDGSSPIYVSARHKAVHYALLADDLARLVPHADALVLDFGCGEALSADRLAASCGRLYLTDGAPSVREKLRERFAGVDAISVIEPEEVDALPKALDLAIMHSVAQYVARDEMPAIVRRLAERLAPGGRLVLSDLLPPNLSPVSDAAALVRLGARHGFAGAALVGLVRTALSDYAHLRRRLGLQHYDDAQAMELLAQAGLTPERLARNPGHTQARRAFVGVASA